MQDRVPPLLQQPAQWPQVQQTAGGLLTDIGHAQMPAALLQKLFHHRSALGNHQRAMSPLNQKP